MSLVKNSTPDDGQLGVDAANTTGGSGSFAGIQINGSIGANPSSLPGSDYRGADFSTRDLSQRSFRRYDFRRVNLRLATLDRSSFSWTDLRLVDFRGASMRNIRFAACDLSGADLRDTDLRGAEFGQAQAHDGWIGVCLERVKFTGANLAGAIYGPETTWPEGFDPDLAGAAAM